MRPTARILLPLCLLVLGLTVANAAGAAGEGCDPANGWAPGAPCTPADAVGVEIGGQARSLQDAYDQGQLNPPSTYTGPGTSGLVPDPGAGDGARVLRADATFDFPGPCDGRPATSCRVLADADQDGDFGDDMLAAVYGMLYPDAAIDTVTGEAVTCDANGLCEGALAGSFLEPGTLVISDSAWAQAVTDDGAGGLQNARASVTQPTHDTGCSSSFCTGNLPALPVAQDTVVFQEPGGQVCAVDAAGQTDAGASSGCTLVNVNAATGAYTVIFDTAPAGNVTADFAQGADSTVDYDGSFFEFWAPATPAAATADYQHFGPAHNTSDARVSLYPPRDATLTFSTPVWICKHKPRGAATAATSPTCDAAPADHDLPRVVFPHAWSTRTLVLDPPVSGAGDFYGLRFGDGLTDGDKPRADRLRIDFLGAPEIRTNRDAISGTNTFQTVWLDSVTGTFRGLFPELFTGRTVAVAHGEVEVVLEEGSVGTVQVDGDTRGLRLFDRGAGTVLLCSYNSGPLDVGGLANGCDYGGVARDADGFYVETSGARVSISDLDGFGEIVLTSASCSATACVEFFIGTDVTGIQNMRGAVRVSGSAVANSGAMVRGHDNVFNFTPCGGPWPLPNSMDLRVSVSGVFQTSSAGANVLGADSAWTHPCMDGQGRGWLEILDAGIVETGPGRIFRTSTPNVFNLHAGVLRSTRARGHQARAAATATPLGCLPFDGSTSVVPCASDAAKWVADRPGTLGAVELALLDAVPASSVACTVRPRINGNLADTGHTGAETEGARFEYGGGALDQAGERKVWGVNDALAVGDEVTLEVEAPLSDFCGDGSGCGCTQIGAVAASMEEIPQ